MKPDFSGEYELDRPACTLSPAAAGVESAVLRIDHHEPVFRSEQLRGGGRDQDNIWEFVRRQSWSPSDRTRCWRRYECGWTSM